MLALAVPFATVSFVVVGALVERAAAARLHDELRLEIERTARIGGQLLAAPLWYVNAGTITANLEVLVRHDDVVAAVARDKAGALVAWCTDRPKPDCGQDDRPEAFVASAWASHAEGIVFDRVGAAEEIGELTIYYTRERVGRLMTRRLVADTALLAALLAALVASIFLVTRRALLMPLRRWREAMRAPHGEGLQGVDWTSADEIGELIREYNERVNEEHERLGELKDRLKMYEDAVESLERGLCLFDRDFRLTAFNRRYLEMLGHGDGSVELGMSLKDLLRKNAARGEYGSASVDAVIIDRLAIAASNETYRRERQRDDGTVIEVESSPTPDGGFVSLYSDITRQKALERQMRHMTLNDPLTGLANRALFHDRLRQALGLADRIGTRLAVLLIDLEPFDAVKKGHEHEIDDEALKQLAQRLRQIVRKSDTVARLDDDRFALVQQYLPSYDEAALLAHRVLGSLSRTFELGGKNLRLTASIGITVYPDDDFSSSNILKNARLALTAAKAEDRRYRFFMPEVDRDVARRRRLEEELFDGLRDGQFLLHYQPRIELATGALVSAEARMRWQHPERGLLPPSAFMDLAEERGLAVPLTDWMLEEACRHRRDWQKRAGGAWRVTVPMSAHRFAEGDVVSSVRSIVEKTALDYRFLEVEVSSDALLAADERVSEDLRVLKTLGVTSVLKDFGNGGGSSFGSLRQLPVDTVKIDRRLIHDLGNDEEAAAIVKAAIDIGRRLELRVGAAGVEEPEQLESLRSDGCDEALGLAVSPPIPGDELEPWIRG